MSDWKCDFHRPVLEFVAPNHFYQLACDRCMYDSSYMLLLHRLAGHPQMQAEMRRVHLNGKTVM